MSGERTQAATPKKLRDARNKGQVARSADLAAGLNLLAAALVLQAAGPRAGMALVTATQWQLAHIAADWSQGAWAPALGTWLRTAGLVTAPLLAVVLAVGLVGGWLQTGFLISGHPLIPNFGRLNPLQGLKRLFSLRSLTELGKSLVKLAVLAVVAWQAVRRSTDVMAAMADGSVAAAVPMLAGIGGDLLLQSGLLLTALGGLDYGYQWWEHQRGLRMSKQEVKEEHKQTEGNPEVRSRRRQRMRELARRQKMLREVPTASVVVTNPTHFAVAMRYRLGQDETPVVVARGRDLFAQRIKRLAAPHGVPVVEDPPLARALFGAVAVGREIPPQFYQAVARIFAFLHRVRPER